MPSPFGPLTLGELIEALERIERAPTAEHMGARERSVYFDWCDMRPGTLASYRGYYEHLALSISDGAPPSLAEFIARCKAALGQTYSGWKGGDYTMGTDTPVWVADRGEAPGWGIMMARDTGYTVVLDTRKFD